MATTTDPPWTNFGSGVAARNGTTSHTINFGFTSVSGRLLVVVIFGGVTNAATGWTEQLQPVNSGELSVFTKVSAGETSITVTHNGSNYPVDWVAQEYPAGSSYDTGIGNTPTVDTFPTLTGLTGGTGNERVIVAARGRIIIGATAAASTWTAPFAEDADLFALASGTDGAYLTVGHQINVTATSVTPAVTSGYTGSGLSPDNEHVVFAINAAPVSGTTTFNKDVVETYRITNAVTKDVSETYRVLGAVTKDVVERFRVYAGITKDVVERFRVFALATKDVVERYRLLAGITKDVVETYRVLGSLTKDVVERYRVLAAFSKDVSEVYTVLAGSTFSKDVAESYRLFGGITKDVVERYRLLGGFSKDATETYRVLGGFSKDVLERYRVYAALTKDLAEVYAVLGGSTFSKDVIERYRLYSTLTKDLAEQYRITGPLAKDLVERYRVSGLISKDLLERYRVYAGFNRDLIERYRVLSSIIPPARTAHGTAYLGPTEALADLAPVSGTAYLDEIDS